MANSEFYTNASTGSNLAGGSDAGSPSMTDSAGTGSWTSATNIYVSIATNGSVAVGQFLSIYSGAATVAAYTARITAVSGGGGSAWTITLSATAFSGAVPTTGATFKAQCGGAWLGPNAAENFPFGFITNALTDSAGDIPRVNLKNNTTYSITANISLNKAGPVVFQGYTTTAGDGGKAIIDGGTSGASYILLTVAQSLLEVRDMIFQNNGATGSSDGVNFSAFPDSTVERVIVNNVRGTGINDGNGSNRFIECEAYACNTSNTSLFGAIRINVNGFALNCIAHDNPGSIVDGFYVGGGSIVDCISDTNGRHGFQIRTFETNLHQCTSYNNASAGIAVTTTNLLYWIQNCTLSNNGTYGVDNQKSGAVARVINCGFWSNTSGQTNGTIDATGTITYAAAPMTDPANGDFSLKAGSGGNAAGRGAFTQTASQYSKTSTSFPDVGAVQGTSIQSGGTNPVGGVFIAPGGVRRSGSY